jgi:maltose alpha-D-glucosyltransferase/alpha-amylase
MRTLTLRTFRTLGVALSAEPVFDQCLGHQVLALREHVLQRFNRFLSHTVHVGLIKCHGDLHLAHFLLNEDQAVMIDFEGEPTRALAYRQLKQCALTDVAGMLRSFYNLAAVALSQLPTGQRSAEKRGIREQLASSWYHATAAAFLREYLAMNRNAALLPTSDEELDELLEVFLLEKAVYQLDYELRNRPAFVDIALRGLRDVIGAGPYLPLTS